MIRSVPDPSRIAFDIGLAILASAQLGWCNGA
jgi:hypothetical protein